MSSLYVITGKDQGKRFDLTEVVLGLGRDRSNSIQLHDTEISRRHAELRRGPDGYSLVDLDSSNGSYVNNEQVQRRLLKSGDRVQIGRTVLLYTGPDPDSSDVLASEVDIIAAHGPGGSRIVQTITQEEGSQIFGDSAVLDSPWLARARSNLQIMYRTALAVSHTLDIDQLLHRIAELIFEWVDCDRGCIMLMDQDTDDLVPKVTKNRKGVDPSENIEISRTILDYVMERKEGVITSDARDDDRWDPGGSIVKLGVREAICVPMQGRYGIVGVIYIDTFTPPGRHVQRHMAQDKFTEEHLKLMVAIGHQAALAVEDTSYYSAMVQAERLAAMGQTIATLSHHIKNILQGIRGGSYLIEEGLKTNETDVIRRGWGIVDKNQERISNLVLDMLTFSKEREPDMVPASINEVAADVVELMQARAKDAKVELVWQPQADIPELTFDPDAIHRALLNVVTNGIDACEKRPDARVVVSTEHRPADALAAVIVEDNGEGIQPADVNKIFSVFESGKGARGTGLGLPVSQKILREHNGDILVASEPGAGSRFRLEFPAIAPELTRETD